MKLTPRQKQIITLLKEGLTRKGIAIKLGIDPNTVRNYIHELYRITGVNSEEKLLKKIKDKDLD